CTEPWLNWRLVMGRPIPMPTWVCPPAPSVRESRSEKLTSLLLKPMVLRLARLLPTTSTAVVWPARAESADENAVNMLGSLSLWCLELRSPRLVLEGVPASGCGVVRRFERLLALADRLQLLPDGDQLF